MENEHWEEMVDSAYGVDETETAEESGEDRNDDAALKDKILDKAEENGFDRDALDDHLIVIMG